MGEGDADMADPTYGHPSFEEAAAELSAPLRRYLERLVGNATSAEDLHQETLMRIARGLPGFKGQSSLRTWAFSIATRVAADHFRRPETRASITDVDESESLPDLAPDHDERIVVDEMNSCVRGVIDSLPEDYRAALVLHDLEGLTAAQTAEICHCSAATAKIRIHRARARLKKALQGECTFYRDSEDVLRCDRKDVLEAPPDASEGAKRRD